MRPVDEAVLPLAMVILGLVIKSATLMVIPLLNIVVTILGEFAVMYPVAKYGLDVVHPCNPSLQ